MTHRPAGADSKPAWWEGDGKVHRDSQAIASRLPGADDGVDRGCTHLARNRSRAACCFAPKTSKGFCVRTECVQALLNARDMVERMRLR